LQEPLRKIQAFGDRLQQKYDNSLGEQGRDYVARMQHSAGRMRTLINDLLAYARVTSKARPFEPVDLNAVVRHVVSDLEGRRQEGGGRAGVGDCPTGGPAPTKMAQPLQTPAATALKFRNPDLPPVVRVAGRVVERDGSPLCELTVCDNGIGFEPAYGE